MTADSPILLIVTAGYLFIVLGVSVWGYFQTDTEDDFLAAGRSIGPWVGGAVLAATQISAGTFVGTLGRHYLTGVSWIWICAINGKRASMCRFAAESARPQFDCPGMWEWQP